MCASTRSTASVRSFLATYSLAIRSSAASSRVSSSFIRWCVLDVSHPSPVHIAIDALKTISVTADRHNSTITYCI